MGPHTENELRLDGRLIERSALRYTPAGVPAVSFSLQHESEQIEAELPRQVAIELQALALGQPSRLIAAAPLGCALKLTGFLAAKSRRSKTAVLHVTTIEFLEGAEHGIQT